MTVDKIIPCICAREAILQDEWSDEGMPQLIVRNGITPHKQFWSAFCPKCGRGSKLDDYKSAYLALRNWNRFQSNLWEMETKGDLFLFE